MRKRDRIQNRVRALLAPGANDSTSSRGDPLLPAQRTPSSPSLPPPSRTASNRGASASKSRNPVLEKALAIHLQKIPEAEKAAFVRASKTIDERALLSDVQVYDMAHKDNSSFRPHAEGLSKFLGLLNRFMGGVAIGIQANPEVSALVVGAVRIVIDLALKFTTFFSRLTDMICTFKDYLEPLEMYAQAADVELVEKTVMNIYGNVLDFGRKARRVFVDVSGDQRRWTSVRAFMRQHWETFESEFVSIKESMQHDLDVLLHSVQALHFDTSRKAEQTRRREEEKKEKSAFLSWVSSIDFEKAHQDTYAKKHERTCDWLIKEPKYQQWFSSSVSSLLWCHGKPGIGKSVLASNVLENITAENELREDTAICFAYYNYRDPQLGDVSQIVAALIKQLCRTRDRIPHDLLQVQQNAQPPSLVGTQERFVSLIEDLSKVYVMFDALDECPERERQDILGFVTCLVTAPISCCVKVFVTSRKEMDIAKAFEDKHIPTIQIRAENVAADIESFARSQVEKLRKGEHGKTLYVTNDDLKERIVQMLAKKADGMFLWVNLQLDSLCQVSKAQKDRLVEDALETLPQGLPDTYLRILERIEGQSPYMRDLAQKCLAWMIHAQRPLSTEELQIALALKPGCSSRQDLELDPPKVILEACGNLLEEAHGAIRPIHYTVQEFLSKAAQGLPRYSIQQQLSNSAFIHTQLSLVCLVYIQLMAFYNPAKDTLDLEDRLKDNIFAGYACQNFDYHIAQCDEVSCDIMEWLEELFRQESQYLAAVLQIKALRDGVDWNTIMQRFDPMSFPVSASTIVYGTLLYDIPDVRRRWANDTPPKNALHLACSAGLVSAVTRLLEEGCDTSEKDGNGTTPLYYASSEGHLSIVRQLLQQDANVNAQGGFCGNALQVASVGGHEPIVKLLLDKGAEVNAQGGKYGNALQAASLSGHEPIVKLLLDKGAEVNAQGGYYGNALQAASAGGYEPIVKLLLDKSAKVNAQGGEYGNALQAASLSGHEPIVKLLLDKGAEVNAQGGFLGNALQAASLRGHEPIMKLLLDKGAEVNAQGGYYGNALQAASAGGYEPIVKLLLDKGAEVNAQGGYYGNVLQAALEKGHEPIVKLLLNKGAE